jgi:hypothetical protein
VASRLIDIGRFRVQTTRLNKAVQLREAPQWRFSWALGISSLPLVFPIDSRVTEVSRCVVRNLNVVDVADRVARYMYFVTVSPSQMQPARHSKVHDVSMPFATAAFPRPLRRHCKPDGSSKQLFWPSDDAAFAHGTV